ncbi:MAG: hypothetical protein IKP00_16970 [Victivallales bacterium]|nr:hypothetical protein [Victivallales bacterium]
MATLKVNFDRPKAQMKPLHGVNNSRIDYTGAALPEFVEAGIPFCRLHDTGGAFGGSRFVDIPNVFPNFDADPDDPASYDFAFTDVYLKSLNASGTQIFYRLGVTIENNFRIKAYRIMPPADYNKWAKICEMIVRHYNEGWANGFHFGIQYWEIWNEPENPPMWQGTMEQFFELYRTASCHLKKCFPELKIGGYACCGFYALTDPRCANNDFYRSFLTWYDEFLKYIKAPETACPLDFFSFHRYTDSPDEVAVHADYAKSKLLAAGLPDTELIFNEWNYMKRGDKHVFVTQRSRIGASFTAATFCVMQDSVIDKAMFYDAFPSRAYGAFYNFPDFGVSCTGRVFTAYNELYKLGTQVETAVAGAHLYACAAASAKGKAVLVVNYSAEPQTVDCAFTGATAPTSIKMLSDNATLDESPDAFHNGTLAMPPYSVALLGF